ncbi:MAG: DHH family phosphoesterase [Lachnospiraceae bacterium]|nr:DHH family phosphoesterase [Lachnospiraceae bacterium]
MDNKSLNDNRILKYLRLPFLLFVILAVMNVVIYIMDTKAGAAVSVFLLIYVLLLVLFYYRYKKSIASDMISFAMDQGNVQNGLLKEMSIPYVLTDTEGRQLWANEGFREIVAGESKPSKKTVFQLFEDFDQDDFPTVVDKTETILDYNERSYRVEMKRVVLNEEVENDALVAIYFHDETELNRYIRENEEQKLVAGLVYIDNYDEAIDSIEEVRQALLSALIDRKINIYMQNIEAIMKKMEKDKYFFVFQQKFLPQLETTKFAILDEVRGINIGNEIAVTLSISIGAEAESFCKAYDYARVAMDMALGRGGDQAVVKKGEKIVYYGGKTRGVEKQTRAKARVKAHALKELLDTKSKVIVMGHHLPDLDCIGSALGVFRVATDLGKEAHIVINKVTNAVKPVFDNFAGSSAYPEDLFINSEQALSIVDSDTLLVVVDVNRPSYTECPELLTMVKSLVVIDHHRQTSEVIQNATLSYVEPYASSACEMVAEILQYIVDKPKLRSAEADAMYEGILTDTNNFVRNTGVRTFEACAFLRRCGADVVRVRKMFRNDMDAFKQRAMGAMNAEVFMDTFAVSSIPAEGVESPTIVASSVANELLNIAGIHASFVLTEIGDQINISARSIDDVNVQVIMERFGGGGHANMAGAQLSNVSLDTAVEQVKAMLYKMRQEGDL